MWCSLFCGVMSCSPAEYQKARKRGRGRDGGERQRNENDCLKRGNHFLALTSSTTSGEHQLIVPRLLASTSCKPVNHLGFRTNHCSLLNQPSQLSPQPSGDQFVTRSTFLLLTLLVRSRRLRKGRKPNGRDENHIWLSHRVQVGSKSADPFVIL